jgi:hypothetical protein
LPSPILADRHTKIRGAQLSIHPRTTEFPGNLGRPLHGEMRRRSPSAITVSFGGERHDIELTALRRSCSRQG